MIELMLYVGFALFFGFVLLNIFRIWRRVEKGRREFRRERDGFGRWK